MILKGKNWQLLTFRMKTVFVLCAILISVCSGQGNQTTINLLLLVPWAETADDGYGPGPDLYGGARVAVSEVNNNSDILPDYRINVIESRNEACGQIESSEGIVNMVRYAINPQSPERVACIIGLYCSTSTQALSPVAGHVGFDIIQLTVANSPTFRDFNYPHLWHFIELASNYANMMLSIMDQFGWRRIAVVNDLVNVFIRGIGDTLVDALESSPDKELLYHGRLIGTEETLITDAIIGIRDSGAFVVFLTMSRAQAVQLFCEAGRYNMHWPNYAWVFADNVAENFFSLENLTCSLELLKHTVENSITSFFTLEPDNPLTLLVSNDTYLNYKSKYELEHESIIEEYGDELTTEEGDFLYGSVAYDQVWAFSLALHSALPELKEKNISIENYGYGQLEVTAILERHLGSVDFQGSSGRIRFNDDRTVSTVIQIYQVRDSVDVLVGTFDSSDTDAFFINVSNPPPDSVTPRPVIIPTALSIVTLIILVVLVVLVTVNMALMLYYRKDSKIKAISPLLSCVIVAGCYFECIAAILLIVQVSVADPPKLGFTVLCNFELFFGMFGMYLILLTALFRLARIFRIFRTPSRLGLLWKDKSLFFTVLAISNYATIIFIIWIPVDTLKFSTSITYYTNDFPVYAEAIGVCSCQYLWIWLGSLCALVVIILVALIFFAVQTRKIKNQSYKNTKKMNGFVFIMTIVIAMYFTMYQVLAQLGIYHYACFVLGLLFATVCLIAQSVFFMPKIYPLLYDKLKQQK